VGRVDPFTAPWRALARHSFHDGGAVPGPESLVPTQGERPTRQRSFFSLPRLASLIQYRQIVGLPQKYGPARRSTRFFFIRFHFLRAEKHPRRTAAGRRFEGSRPKVFSLSSPRRAGIPGIRQQHNRFVPAFRPLITNGFSEMRQWEVAQAAPPTVKAALFPDAHTKGPAKYQVVRPNVFPGPRRGINSSVPTTGFSPAAKIGPL